nr:homeobox protein HAT3.1 [Tanacetum cinerariifolium]
MAVTVFSTNGKKVVVFAGVPRQRDHLNAMHESLKPLQGNGGGKGHNGSSTPALSILLTMRCDVSTTMIIQLGPVVDFSINNQNVKDPYDSLEKLRPKKELECAKSDINRYKLKIRDLFKQTDTSLKEGKFLESLYDSDRLMTVRISTRTQTDVRLDNDIILCDGACDHGFH